MDHYHHDQVAGRLSLNHQGQEIGHLTYQCREGRWNITHTEISPEQGGKGFGKALIRALGQEARKAEVKLEASCRFAAKVLHEDPDLADLNLNLPEVAVDLV